MSIISAASLANLEFKEVRPKPDRWNSADAGANFTVTHDFKVTSVGASTSGFIRTNTGKTSGKYYFEISWEEAETGTGTVACGLVQSTLANTSNTYTTNQAWTVWGRNAGARHNSVNAHAFASDATERWGFAVDLDAGELWIWDSNGSAWLQGDPETGTSPTWSNLTGTLHPFAQPWYSVSAPHLSLTLHSSPKSLSRAAPDGFVAGWPAYDPYWNSVVLLLPLDGADAATTASDLSNEGHTLTFNANAQLDTAQSKFGTASALFDGAGDYISIPDALSLSPESVSFTVECHVRFNGDPTTDQHTFVGKWVNGQTAGTNKEWWVGYRNNKLNAFLSSNGTNGIFMADVVWDPAGDTWYHIAFVFDRELATNETRVYVDGTQVGSSDTALNSYASFFQSAADVWIGGYDADANDWMDGWIDNVRITKGVARYTGTFTPPTSPFPTS